MNIIQAPLPEDSSSNSNASYQENPPTNSSDEEPETPLGYHDLANPMKVDPISM